MKKLLALLPAIFMIGCATVKFDEVAYDANGNVLYDADGSPVVLQRKMPKQAYITQELMKAQIAQSLQSAAQSQAEGDACPLDKEFIASLSASAQKEAMTAYSACQANGAVREARKMAIAMAKEIKIAGGQPPTETRIAEATVKGNMAHDAEITKRIVGPIANVVTLGQWGLTGYFVDKALQGYGQTNVGDITVNQSGKSGAGGEMGGSGSVHGQSVINIGDKNQNVYSENGPAVAGSAEKQNLQAPSGTDQLNDQNTQNAAEGGPTAPFFDDSGDGSGSGFFGSSAEPSVETR